MLVLATSSFPTRTYVNLTPKIVSFARTPRGCVLHSETHFRKHRRRRWLGVKRGYGELIIVAVGSEAAVNRRAGGSAGVRNSFPPRSPSSGLGTPGSRTSVSNGATKLS